MPDQVAFGRRLFAIVLDWFMCLGIAHQIYGNLLGGAQFLPLAIFLVEVSVLTALTGSSAGQRILRIRVVDATTGGAIGAGRAFRRTLFICLVFPAIFTKVGRGYHDLFTNSVVVKY